MIERQVGYRGELVEVAVFFQPRLDRVPGVLEFLVLHFELNLVDLKFVDQFPHFGVGLVRSRFRALLSQTFLGLPASFYGFSCVRGFGSHGLVFPEVTLP